MTKWWPGSAAFGNAVKTSNDQDYLVDAVALNLHCFYAGVERLLELIADSIDQAKPQGARGWG